MEEKGKDLPDVKDIEVEEERWSKNSRRGGEAANDKMRRKRSGGMKEVSSIRGREGKYVKENEKGRGRWNVGATRDEEKEEATEKWVENK